MYNNDPRAPELEAIFDRITRAQEHLDAIKGELLSYYKTDLCTARGQYKPDNNGGKVDLSTPPLKGRPNTLIGEFLHDLRSSLDHLAWQLVSRNGGTAHPEKTNFPIMRIAPTTDRPGKQALPNIPGGVSMAARKLIDEAQPYKLGDLYAYHSLWVLHQLWNIDKHRYVIAKGGNLKLTFPGDPPRFTFGVRLGGATEHGANLVVAPDDPAMDVDAYIAVQVTLHEPENGIESRPLVKVLESVHQQVFTLVSNAEDRCF
jgi:hypothetical protein